MLLIGELERAHLAEIIHDDVLQILGAGLLAADNCEQAWRLGRSELLPDHLAKTHALLDQAIARLRQLVADLQPYKHAADGLEVSLRGVFRAFRERNGGSISLTQTFDRPLTAGDELLGYRLILESLWSVRGFDQPLDVDVELRVRAETLRVRSLFRPRTPPSGGNVLTPSRVATMRWRVQAMGGELLQEPQPPAGVLLGVSVPLRG